jgi:hypothetical protein
LPYLQQVFSLIIVLYGKKILKKPSNYYFLSKKRISPAHHHSNGLAVFRMVCWGDTKKHFFMLPNE